MCVCAGVSTGLPVKRKQFLVFAHITFCGEMNHFRVCLFCSTNAKLKHSLIPSYLFGSAGSCSPESRETWTGRLHPSAAFPPFPLTLAEGSFRFVLGSSAPAQPAWYCTPFVSCLSSALEYPLPWGKVFLCPCFLSWQWDLLAAVVKWLNRVKLPTVALVATAQTSCECADCRFSSWGKQHGVCSSHSRGFSAPWSCSGRTGIAAGPHKAPVSDFALPSRLFLFVLW